MAIIIKSFAADVGLPPWFVKRAAELSAAVGRVSVGGSLFGTGFLITPKILLTCQHVLPDVQQASQSTFELDYQRDEDGTFRRVTSIKLRPEAFFVADRALDFVAVGLEVELRDRHPIPLTDDGNTTPGEQLSLFHHAQAGPLLLSLRRGLVLTVSDDFLHHNVDTLPGSAGAPLLDQSLRLVGLHHSSVPAREGARTANEAVRTTSILAMLARSQPELFGQALSVNAVASSQVPIGPISPPGLAVAAASEIVETGVVLTRDSVFISYAHDDQGKRKWRERLRKFLSPFGAELDVWDDSRIETGAQWRKEIDIALRRARVAVLLVGPSFLSSNFIKNDELPPLLKAAAAEGVPILPLITNHCAYERTELGKFQSFNDPKKPLEALDLSNQNRSLLQFAEEIDKAFKKWHD
jgi:hypothetical protein